MPVSTDCGDGEHTSACQHSQQSHCQTDCPVSNALQLSQMSNLLHWQVHTHARYELCEEADAFRTAEYMSDMKQPGADRSETCRLPALQSRHDAAFVTDQRQLVTAQTLTVLRCGECALACRSGVRRRDQASARGGKPRAGRRTLSARPTVSPHWLPPAQASST